MNNHAGTSAQTQTVPGNLGVSTPYQGHLTLQKSTFKDYYP